MPNRQPTRAALRAAKLLRPYGSSVALSGAAGFMRIAGHPLALELATRLLKPPPAAVRGPQATLEIDPETHQSNARTFGSGEHQPRTLDSINRKDPARERQLLKPTERKMAATHPAAARASISKGAASGPWLRIKQNKSYTDVTLTVELAAGQWTSFHARIDHAMIRKLLERGGVEIGFSLGGVWKGIKKVAKATGVSKVLGIASKVLKNPIVTAVFPVASIAARATESGLGMLHAATRAKKGTKADKVAAATLIQASHAKAKGGDVVQKKALKMLSRTYRIVVEPLAVSGDPLNAFDQAA